VEEVRENLILLYIHKCMGLDDMLPKVLRKLGNVGRGHFFTSFYNKRLCFS